MTNDLYNPAKPFNEQVRRLIQDTHNYEGSIRIKRHGKRFTTIRNSEHARCYSAQEATDGIGTKGLLHYKMGTFSNGVQDAFAMVADDHMEGGYIPVHLQDHIMIQGENEEYIFAAVTALRNLCLENPWEDMDGKYYPIIITGGETAIINTLQGFEMGITATGYAKNGEEIYPRIEDGDIIIGLGSNGIHSNGLSFFREELFDKQRGRLDDMLSWGTTIGEELTKPTYIYMPALKELIKYMRGHIHGMVHITGGGLSKLREWFPEEKNLDVQIKRSHSLKPQEIFHYAHDLGTPSEKMYTRFNNGVGYAITIDKSKSADALDILRKHYTADIIGEVSRGTGKVLIESQYNNETIVF